jgi:MFS family permease
MIEVYLFLAVFPVQILAVSVLYPVRFTRLIRTGLAKIPAERLTELYPGVDVGHAYELFITRYRTANTVVVILGLLLLGWFSRYMQGANWDAGAVGVLVIAYFVVQYSPLALIAWFTTRFNKVHRRASPEGKRKAILQRRGLLDFVSPLTAVLAVLSFLLFAAVSFYVAQDPFPGYGGPFANIGIVVLMYVVFGAVLYWMRISVVVNCYAWVCILIPIFIALSLAQKMLDLPTWGPFATSLSFLVLALLSLPGLIAWPRRPEADGLGSGAVHQ